MSSSGSNIKHAFIMTIVVAAIYVFLLARMGFSFSLSNPGLLLRIPFIFILSFVFLYYAQEEKRLIQIQAERVDRLTMIGEMTADIIHEIKNPLTVILGNAQILDDVDPDVARKELWPDIVKATQLLSTKINSILAFARNDNSETMGPIDIVSTLRSALEMCRSQLLRDHIKINEKFHEGLPTIFGSRNGIDQVFVNIITNANYALTKFKPKEDRKLYITIEKQGKKIVITFKDNGPGIDKEGLEKIFTPFYTTKPEGEGTGLGLSICYKIIKQHGGDIRVSSKAGLGAAFIIELPITETF